MFGKKKISLKESIDQSHWIRWGLLFLVTLIFVLLLYPDLFEKKIAYESGDVAFRDVKAPKDFFIENRAATETGRKHAVDKIPTVYDLNAALLPKLRTRVDTSFARIRQAVEEKKQAYAFDFVPDADTAATLNNEIGSAVHDLVWELKPGFEEQLGVPVSDGAYTVLETERFSMQIVELIDQILTKILNIGVVANKELLLREAKKGITLRNVTTQSEQTVADVRRFYGLDQAKIMVRITGDPLLKQKSYPMRNLIVDIVQDLIQPNITLNRNETEKRKQTAAQGVKPVRYKIKAGEMLLREGERVTDVQLMKLRALQSQTNTQKVISGSLGAAMIMACLLVSFYVLLTVSADQRRNLGNKNLLFLATTVVLFMVLTRIWATLSETFGHTANFAMTHSGVAFGLPLAAATMVICLFLGLRTAVSMAVVLAVAAGILFHNRLDLFAYFLISGVMAAYWIRHCRERKVFVKAGLKIGLLSMVLATAIRAYWGELAGAKLIWDGLFALFGGMGAGIITAGLAPLFEITFDYTTDIKLLELANLDQPILRRLMIEAPGTYHHSVIVGSLVEAAAADINANPLLAKVCGYYHDIGKLKMPLYFIENQAGGVNKHDKLSPSMSKRILIAHIKDGVDLAKQNRLGQTIVDTIVQHHGNSVIRYFFEKAKDIKGDDGVQIDDYRYPGPRPQTREAGLVMLADVVEAASRTLANPTPARIQGLVQNLINKVFSDGQLDQCELTLKDLHKIARSYTQILTGIHHHRIEYPDQTFNANGKGKNGGSSGQSTKRVRNFPPPNTKNSESHLKRLGLP